MTQQSNQSSVKTNTGDKQAQAPVERKLPFQAGGIYFHSGVIIGRKNVFVTHEYLDLLANALKMTELKKDIKNLAYVIMPNFFYWMFRLSEKTDNPLPIIGELKKNVAGEILNNLRKEVKEKSFELIDLFKSSDKVQRSSPQKILWTFEEQAKNFEKNKRYRVWAPHTGIQLINSDEALQQKLTIIKNAPVSERWQIVARAEEYPYLYLADEVSGEEEKLSLNVIQLVQQPTAVPVA